MTKKRNKNKKRKLPWYNNMLPGTLDMGLWETLCRNCGECCKIHNVKTNEPLLDKNGNYIYCKYLKFDKYGKSSCKIYYDNKRLGMHIGHGNYCNFIKQSITIPDKCGYRGIIERINELEEIEKNE